MEVRKTSPVVMTAQTIRASLLANATATTLDGLRALSAANQSHNAPLRFGAARKTEMAPNRRRGRTEGPGRLGMGPPPCRERHRFPGRAAGGQGATRGS